MEKIGVVKVVFKCRIPELRKEHGLTLRALAKITGIGNPTISFIERGTNPTLIHAMKLAKAFNKPIEEIWEPL